MANDAAGSHAAARRLRYNSQCLPYRGGKSSRWNSRALISADWREAIGLAAVLLVAAFLRLNNLQSRADWDSDQGSEMLAIWNALHSGTIPQLGPLASTGTFHHGALY